MVHLLKPSARPTLLVIGTALIAYREALPRPLQVPPMTTHLLASIRGACGLICLLSIMGQGHATQRDQGGAQRPGAHETKEARVWKEALLGGCRTREEAIQDLTVVVAAYRGGESKQVTLTRVTQGGGFEKWASYRIEADSPTPLDEGNVAEIMQNTPANIVPKVTVFDGNRSISFIPTKKAVMGRSLIEGVLSADSADVAFRAGGLHCGFLFAERWLSEVLSEFSVVEIAMLENGGTSLQLLQPENKPEMNLQLDLDAGGMIRRVQHNRAGKMVCSFSIDATETVDGVVLPKSGELKYSYAERPIQVLLQYVPKRGGLPKEQRDLMRLPEEFKGGEYSTKIFDLSAGKFFSFEADAPAMLTQSPVSQQGATDVDAGRSERATQLTGSLWPTIAGLFVVVAAVLIAIRRRRS